MNLCVNSPAILSFCCTKRFPVYEVYNIKLHPAWRGPSLNSECGRSSFSEVELDLEASIQVLIVPRLCPVPLSPCVFAEEGKRWCLALSSLLPLFCPPPAVLPLGLLCQGPLPKYLWFIFACWKVSTCTQDNEKLLRNVAQSSLNSFWLFLSAFNKRFWGLQAHDTHWAAGREIFLLLLLLPYQSYIVHE